jgi:hydrogenase maturation protease HycI
MLASLKTRSELPRLAIMGIGHELRGDDAVGVVVARKLKRLLAYQVHILIVEAGAAPENMTAPLRRFAPDLALLVDAAQLNESPGAVRLLPWEKTTGLSACTHMLPPHMVAQYLHKELGCEVALLGIQPAHTTLCAGLSPAIKAAADDIVRLLISALTPYIREPAPMAI